LALGTWQVGFLPLPLFDIVNATGWGLTAGFGVQGIWYLEFRAAKHTRKVVATIQGEKK